MHTILFMLYVLYGSVWPEQSGDAVKCPSLCTCKRYKSFCLNRGHKLTYIPPLPQGITHLKFSGNALYNVTRQTFRNLIPNKMKSLTLESNCIISISRDAFQDLKHLRSLHLGREYFLHYARIEDMFHSISRSIEVLTNYKMRWRTFPSVGGLATANIHTLGFSHMHVRYLNGYHFQKLRNLRYLDVSFNGMKANQSSFEGLASLERLNFAGNWQSSFPDVCQANLTNLRSLNLQYNKFTSIDGSQIRCLDNLQFLNMDGHAINWFHNDTFSNLQSLNELSLKRLAGKIFQVESKTFSSQSLQNLYLTQSPIPFFDDIFAYCPNLLLLDLSYIDISETQPLLKRILKPLRKLQRLFLIGSGLTDISNILLTYLPSLNLLDVSRNQISSFPDSRGFIPLMPLKVLDMSRNVITTINKTTFDLSLLGSLDVLNLTYNPFSCGCKEMSWFYDWMSSSKHTKVLRIDHLPNAYVCASPNRIKGTSFENLTYIDVCPIDPKLKIAIIACTSIVLATLLMLFVLYRMRWQIRYLLFIWRQNMKRANDNYSIFSTEENAEYDCFIVYADEDRDFVTHHLIRVLEEEQNVRLCVPDRDFEVGRVFVDNITDNIEKSRRIMLILSDHFARSNWCDFQLAVALHKAIEQKRNLLVVVELTEISFRYLTSTLRTLITTSSLLTWPDENGAKELFWEQLLVKFPVLEVGNRQ